MISESLAVADGVKRTFWPDLRLPDGFANLIPAVAGGRATSATGALLNGCCAIGPYALLGGLNLGACRPPVGADKTVEKREVSEVWISRSESKIQNLPRVRPGCGTRDDSVIPDGSIPRNLWRRFGVPGTWCWA